MLACFWQTSKRVLEFRQAYEDMFGETLQWRTFDPKRCLQAVLQITIGDCYTSYVRSFLQHWARKHNVKFNGRGLRVVCSLFLSSMLRPATIAQLRNSSLQRSGDAWETLVGAGFPDTKSGKFIGMIFVRLLWIRLQGSTRVFSMDGFTTVFWGAQRRLSQLCPGFLDAGAKFAHIHKRLAADVNSIPLFVRLLPAWLQTCTQHALCDQAQSTNKSRRKRRAGTNDRKAKRIRYHTKLQGLFKLTRRTRKT